MSFTYFMITIIAILFCVYKRWSMIKSVIILTSIYLIGALSGDVSLVAVLAVYLVAGFFGQTRYRQRFITPSLLKFYKQVSPEMSNTEQEAIDAGTVWWDGELFSGQPDWEKLHAIGKPTLTAEEQDFLDGPVETVCLMVDEWQINHKDADLSPEIWQYLKDKTR